MDNKLCNKQKVFTQEEINRIVALRLKRERERIAKNMESCLAECFNNIQKNVIHEMQELQQNIHTETKDSL